MEGRGKFHDATSNNYFLDFFFAANNHKNEPENKPETEIKNKKKEE